jgi:hypothetical protein
MQDRIMGEFPCQLQSAAMSIFSTGNPATKCSATALHAHHKCRRRFSEDLFSASTRVASLREVTVSRRVSTLKIISCESNYFGQLGAAARIPSGTC